MGFLEDGVHTMPTKVILRYRLSLILKATSVFGSGFSICSFVADFLIHILQFKKFFCAKWNYLNKYMFIYLANSLNEFLQKNYLHFYAFYFKTVIYNENDIYGSIYCNRFISMYFT